MRKINYEIGQKLELEMLPNSNVGQTLPIMRTNKGVIAFIKPGTIGRFPLNSIWECEVIEIREKCIIVKPIEMTMTPQANEYEAHRKLMKAWGVKPAKKEKVKINYQYASKIEQLKSAQI